MSNGIWSSGLIKDLVELEYRVTLDEGHTPLVHVNNAYFKQEYLNPTGSIKDRGMAVQISYLNKKQITKAVIASSGNASISAINYANKANILIKSFLPLNSDKPKIETISLMGGDYVLTENSLKSASKYAQEHGYYFIRPSVNIEGSWGYLTLGDELINQPNKFDWIVFPVSSGTSAIGTFQAYKILNRNLPKLLVVQTSSIHPIAKDYDPEFLSERNSIATGIVSKYPPHKNDLHRLIRDSNGDACVVDNAQIQMAYEELLSLGFYISYDSAVAWAGWRKYQTFTKTSEIPCIILTGINRSSS